MPPKITTQSHETALSALKQAHTNLHDIIHRATRDSSSDLIKADIARVIAVLANAMAVL